MATAEEKKADKMARAEEAETSKKKMLRLGKQQAERALAARSKVATVYNSGLGPAVSAVSGYGAGFVAGRMGSRENPHAPAIVKGVLETVLGMGLAFAGHATMSEQASHLAAGSWGFLAGDTGYRHGQEMRAKSNAPNPGPSTG